MANIHIDKNTGTGKILRIKAPLCFGKSENKTRFRNETIYITTTKHIEANFALKCLKLNSK